MGPKFTNRLINESSPYLRQHAHNPVDWYPWGKEALQRSKDLDLPVLVSIGYSACHWCHVMEHESFENEEVAAFMNEHFINIKIDREERPDLDHIYMDAVQAISGSGGWPLNVFLTTETKPFYGGTYFPPQKAFNRPSWMDILSFISGSWKNKRDEIIRQADILVDHIHSSGNQLLKDFVFNDESRDFTSDDCKTISKNILSKADEAYGGFGAAPKFPQTFTLQYLLMYGHFFKLEKALQHAVFSLKQMLNGGIYDHLAGGMSRYSTDKEWLAPHFEKMLYDNALLVTVLSDAFQVTNDALLKNGIDKTLQFLILDMKHPAGGFYAAFDADSEGVEGKFYVWDKKEIEEVIKNDAGMCCEWYGVTKHGNWEEKNILHISKELSKFAKEKNIAITELQVRINSWNEQLLNRRKTRVHPSVDDKILLGWNALLLTAFCKAYAATSVSLYKEEAIALFDFIVSAFKKKGGGFYHTYKEGIATYPAFLDDYAYMIQACIFLQEITSNQNYLLEAKEITEYVIQNFTEETGMFYYTNQEQNDILLRKTEVYDGAVPSGNSIMADNLFYLSVIYDNRDWSEKAHKMMVRLKDVILKYPTSFGVWAAVILKQNIGIHEIAVTGKVIRSTVEEMLGIYMPNKVFQSSEAGMDFPLLMGKNFKEKVWIYLCKQYACQAPVTTVKQLKNLIK